MAFAKTGNANVHGNSPLSLNWQPYPIDQSATKEDLAVYEVGPYVLATDGYIITPSNVRDGSIWYSGSTGWTYQPITEFLPGLQRGSNKLSSDCCIPAD
jgi:cyclic beta-1,2-glucan synthetase